MNDMSGYHAGRCDELVAAEGCQFNLGRLLHTLALWSNARVLEAGMRTARLTKPYVRPIAERSLTKCSRSG